MDMDKAFQRMIEGVRMADAARDEIMKGLQEAWVANNSVANHVADLEEHIVKLEGLIVDLGNKIKELKDSK